VTIDFRQTPEYQRALSFVFDRINFERVKKMPYSKRDLNIQRMRQLLGLLGDPHDQLRIVHIAGTKGKGSTSAFLTSAFVAGNIRCGSYTSPHLQHVEERFRIDGIPCSPRQLVELIDAVRPAVAEMDRGELTNQPTYFEVCTAIAFLLFVREKVDVAILEVGLGGRLDSTNVCTPLVSVITSISFDHMKQLGNTLHKIATEKAGIIKPNVPVVSGATDTEAAQAIKQIANERGSELFELNEDFVYQYSAPEAGCFAEAGFRAKGKLATRIRSAEVDLLTALEGAKLGLVGEHQAKNASIAWSTLQLLPQPIRPSNDAIRTGFERTHCEARIEVVSHSPVTIIDSSHNVASVQALVGVMRSVYAKRHRILILGATIGKDIQGMLEVLLPAFDQVVFTQYEDNPRALSAKSLFEKAEGLNATPQPQLFCDPGKRDALKRARDLAGANHPKDIDTVICVTGSFFIAAEMATLLTETKG